MPTLDTIPQRTRRIQQCILVVNYAVDIIYAGIIGLFNASKLVARLQALSDVKTQVMRYDFDTSLEPNRPGQNLFNHNLQQRNPGWDLIHLSFPFKFIIIAEACGGRIKNQSKWRSTCMS